MRSLRPTGQPRPTRWWTRTTPTRSSLPGRVDTRLTQALKKIFPQVLDLQPGLNLYGGPMNGYSIAQAAGRTGFSASALRYYERSGLVHPARTAAGYRSYDDAQVERLSFIGRAKGLGLSLDEINDLVSLLDQDQCEPVQGRLRALVDAKVADAQARIAELVAFTGELQRVSATLDQHTPDGPCDDACGCTSEPTPGQSIGVALIAKPAASSETPVACTLEPERVGDRLSDWQRVLADATVHEPIDGGVRAWFSDDTDAAALAGLAASEQQCCRFFTFSITISAAGLVLDITGPPDARPVINELVGVPA